MKEVYRTRNTRITERRDFTARIDHDHFNKRALKNGIKFFENALEVQQTYTVSSITHATDIARRIVEQGVTEFHSEELLAAE